MSAVRILELINFENLEKPENLVRGENSENSVLAENSVPSAPDRLALRETSAMRLWLRKGNPNTARAYKRALADFLASCGAENIRTACASREAGECAILAYTAALEPYAASTQNQRLSAIAKLLQLCEAEGVIPEKVSHLVLRPQVTWEVPELEELPSPEKVQAMLASEKVARNRVLLSLLYLTGCRCSEAAGLRWQDIRRRGAGLQLKIHGKGSKTRRVMIENEWLIIELAYMKLAALELDQKPRAKLYGKACPSEKSNDSAGNFVGSPVDSNDSPGSTRDSWRKHLESPVFVLSASQIARICRAAWQRVGVKDDARRGTAAHLLRHCHATHVRLAGASATELQQTLGHSREETTAMYGAVAAAGSGRVLKLPW